MSTIQLLETNAITALANNNELAWRHWSSLPEEDEVLSCFVVVAEWEYGIRNVQGRKKQQEIREQGELVLSGFSRIIESSPEIAIAYGEIAAELREAGSMIPQNDSWIAAVARVVGAVVVTSDKHFQHVKNLSIVDWTKP